MTLLDGPRIERLTLPWPPSVNAWTRAIPRGGHAVNVLTRQARAFKTEAKISIGFWPMPFTGELFMTVVLYPPDRRKRDVDNYSKAILDALTYSGVWEDDAQVKFLQIEMSKETFKGGKVELTIGER